MSKADPIASGAMRGAGTFAVVLQQSLACRSTRICQGSSSELGLSASALALNAVAVNLDAIHGGWLPKDVKEVVREELRWAPEELLSMYVRSASCRSVVNQPLNGYGQSLV